MVRTAGTLAQGLIEVGDDIFGVFDTQRQTNEIVLNADCPPFLGCSGRNNSQ